MDVESVYSLRALHEEVAAARGRAEPELFVVHLPRWSTGLDVLGPPLAMEPIEPSAYWSAPDLPPRALRSSLAAAETGRETRPAPPPSWTELFAEVLEGGTAPRGSGMKLVEQMADEVAEADPSRSPPARAFAASPGAGPVAVFDRADRWLAHEDARAGFREAWRAAERGTVLLVVPAWGGSPLKDEEPLPDRRLRLARPDVRATGRGLPSLPAREQAVAFGAFGGAPRWLRAARGGSLGPEPPSDRKPLDLSEAIRRVWLDPEGAGFEAMDTLFARLPEIRGGAEYRAVFGAVAAGNQRIPRIAEAAGLADRPQAVRRRLEALEERDLLHGWKTVGVGRTAPLHYEPADPAAGFWYRMVAPRRSQVLRGRADEVWKNAVKPAVSDSMEGVFRRIAADLLERYSEDYGLPEVGSLGRVATTLSGGRPVSIDLVGRTPDGELLVGQTAWEPGRSVEEADQHLRADLKRLARAGHDWAEAGLQGTPWRVLVTGPETAGEGPRPGRRVRMLSCSALLHPSGGTSSPAR